jgi:hypothetical protein
LKAPIKLMKLSSPTLLPQTRPTPPAFKEGQIVEFHSSSGPLMAQVVDHRGATELLIKHWPLIDYAMLKEKEFVSQSLLNTQMGKSYRAPEAPFDESANLAATVSCITVYDRTRRSTSWDRLNFIGTFQYEWVPQDTLTAVESVPEEIIDRFRKGVQAYESSREGFMKAMNSCAADMESDSSDPTSDGENKHFLMCMEQFSRPPVLTPLSSQEQKRALGIPIHSPSAAVIAERIRKWGREAFGRTGSPGKPRNLAAKDGGAADTKPDVTDEVPEVADDRCVTLLMTIAAETDDAAAEGNDIEAKDAEADEEDNEE